MDSSEKKFIEVNKLIELAIEGLISSEQSQLLNHMIVSDPEICRHYCEYIQLTVCIERLSATISVTELPEYDVIYDQELWDQFAREEKTAPEVELPSEQSQELIQKVVYPPREKRKLSKFAIFTLVNSAAVFLAFVLLSFVPPRGGIEVATLTDSIDAKWTNTDVPMENGARISKGFEFLTLSKGYAELLFDNQAQVIVEGPAEFQIITDDRVCLNYGKVYLKVPTEAIGFSVYTPNAKIIDMGTEFGVQAQPDGNTQLHVVKGKTLLMAGKSGEVNLEIHQGNAKRIMHKTGDVSDIEYQSGNFVHEINSESNFIWKGQTTLDLTDIVGGGDGFGTGQLEMTIDPVSAKQSRDLLEYRRESSNDYHLFPLSPYIDGVFVPNGETEQVVSSQGHVFLECPVTSGLCSQTIRNVKKKLDYMVFSDADDTETLVPGLLLHANMGITFDLQAMRELLPDVHFARFRSNFGMRKWATRPAASNADFWILVDGKIRYQKQHVKSGSYDSVDIELSEEDRFLTLIQTEGDDPVGRIMNGETISVLDSDWGVFTEPVLVLE